MPIFAGCPGMAVISAPLVTPPRFRVVSRRGHRNNSVMSDGNTMRAWSVRHPAPMSQGPLISQELPVPDPAEHEVLVRVSVCGVCRTDLHVAEGDLPVHRAHVVPGHEVVWTVVGRGSAVQDMPLGDRVGIAWLRSTCGRCAYCRRDAENLCPASRFTGWDADGGYAEFAVVDARYAYRLPEGYDDATLAPLLCAGIIGYRALRRSGLAPGGRLGIYGFGGSAHLTAQVAMAEYGARVHVMTRSADARRLATDLGADSVAGAYDEPPEPLDAAILFALTIDRGAWGFHRGVPIGPAMSSTAAAMPRPEDSAGLAPYFTDAEDLLAAVTVGSIHAANPRDTDRVLTLLAQTDALLASGPGTHTPVSELLSDIELALVHLSGPGDYPLGVSDALSRDALARHRVLPRIREFLASAESGV